MTGQSEQQVFDLVIVGAGMTGAALACSLAVSGLRIALIDHHAVPSTDEQTLQPDIFEPRVSALTPASQAFFERLGVWDDIRARRVCPYRRMEVWEADGTGAIRFEAGDIHADVLGHIVENRWINEALHARLRSHENVSLLAPATVRSMQRGGDSQFVRLEDGRSLQTRLLIGADGARSGIRDMAGFRVREWDYGHRALVTTVRTEQPHGQTARQRFSDDGVLAFLPLLTAPGDDSERYCSIVWSVAPERAKTLLAMEDSQFAAVLGRALEHRLGAIETVSERFSFPLHQCHATDYVKGRIALVGDAAHSIHPLAGQGANLGLLDAETLSGCLRQAMDRGLAWDEPAVLRRYQRQRMGHNLAMAGLMEVFRRLYADQPLAVRWLRNTGMRGVDRLKPLKHHIMREAMGLSHAG